MNDRIRRVRKSLKLKQYDLSKSLDVCPATYSRYEKGVLKPDIFKLCKIADILHVSVDYLLKRTEIPCLLDGFVFGEKESSGKEVVDFITKYINLDQRSKDMLGKLIEHEYSLTKHKQ